MKFVGTYWNRLKNSPRGIAAYSLEAFLELTRSSFQISSYPRRKIVSRVILIYIFELKILNSPSRTLTLSIMAEICPTCGLPRDICVCGEISKEQQRIRVRMETRKWRKAVTIVNGIDAKDTDLGRLAQKLKTFCACGGTAKNSEIILQGDHREKVKSYLIQVGYPEPNIEVQ